MAQLSKTDEAAIEAYNRWENHSWYLDPAVVPIVLANNDWSMESRESEEIAKKLFHCILTYSFCVYISHHRRDRENYYVVKLIQETVAQAMSEKKFQKCC